MAKVRLWGYRCERCGHEWLPRTGEEPRVCPRCKSPYWNRPRQRKPRKGEDSPPPEQRDAASDGGVTR